MILQVLYGDVTTFSPYIRLSRYANVSYLADYVEFPASFFASVWRNVLRVVSATGLQSVLKKARARRLHLQSRVNLADSLFGGAGERPSDVLSCSKHGECSC